MLQSNSTSNHSMEKTEEIAKETAEEKPRETTQKIMKKTATEWFQRIAYQGLTVIGSLILLGMVYYSLFYTEFMKQFWVDVPEDRKDQPLWNVAALLILTMVIFAFGALKKLFSEKGQKHFETGLLILSACWILAWGMIWIFSADRVPEGDPAYIYGGASYFIEGRFFYLGHGSYCQLYPQQLAQIAVVELFFLLVGTYNYFAIEFVCVIFATGIHLLGYGILKECKAGYIAKTLYCLLMMGCIPLICYTSWTYGDLPSTFFSLVFALLALKLREKLKWYYVAGMAASFMMAAMVRKNSMIFLVAFFIIAFLDLVIKRRWRMVVTAVLALTVSLLSYHIVYRVYEYQSGVKIEKGLPVNSWLAMGMEENWNGNGWYDDTPKSVGVDYDWDYDAIERYFSAYIKGRLEDFREDPKYAIGFYKKKLVSQWNGPLYQCIYFSKGIPEDKKPAEGSFLHSLYQYKDAYELLLFWADRWQFLIYLGALLYFLTKIRKSEEPVNLLLAVTIVGGFFFSVIWEAKGRYCLPYYLMMYPLAGMGFEKVFGICGSLPMRNKKKGLRESVGKE